MRTIYTIICGLFSHFTGHRHVTSKPMQIRVCSFSRGTWDCVSEPFSTLKALLEWGSPIAAVGMYPVHVLYKYACLQHLRLVRDVKLN